MPIKWSSAVDSIHFFDDSADHPQIQNMVRVVQVGMPVIRRYFDIPAKITFYFRRLNGQVANYTGGRQILRVDPYAIQKMTDLFATLIHECTHAEQFHIGKLKPAGETHLSWCGEDVLFVKPSEDYEGYLALPWEIEAFANTKVMTMPLVQEVIDDISQSR